MQIKAETGGERLDVYLAKHYEGVHTRSQINNGIRNGSVLLNGERVKSGTVLRTGDVIEVNIEDKDLSAVPEEMAIDIVYQDEDLLIINKPRGMVVHPGAGNKSGTLLNGLLHINRGFCSGGGGKGLERAGIVHRLDKNTAGLMVAAKTAQCQARLSAMFERHEVKRTYIGIVEGILKGSNVTGGASEGQNEADCGTIDKNIVRDPNHRTLFKTAVSGGRRAVTHYRVLRTFSKWTLVQFNLETGRTHQIRVHCKSIGHALVGDPEYNPNSSFKTGGQLLESIEISFRHPITGVNISHSIEPSSLFRDITARIS